jgi:glycosyltransferase involved in cell wall biosynthesis
LYPVGNVEQLSTAIEFLHSRPKLAQAMGEAGLEKVRRDHSPELHYETLMQIYTRVARARTPRALRTAAPPARLKIAFIGGRGVISRYSGIETYYEEAGGGLAQRGHEVTIYCRTYFTPEQSHYKNMRLVRLPTLRTKHMDTLLHTFLSTLHACRERYDVVHYHTLGPAVFSYLPRLFGARTIVTVQGLDWRRKKWGRFASAALRLGEWAAVTLPDRTVVVSRTLRNYFRRLYAVETEFIPNGTTLTPQTRGPHLARWGLTTDQYVLFLGRFSPEKNCDLLIRAFEGISTNAKLVLAGGSSYTDEYVEKLRRQAGNRVQFLDWVSGEALQELVTNAAVFVLPSDMEGLSLALLDAMGAGVCVLASDVPENRELVDDVGFTFPSGDEAELSRMLELLLSDPEMRKRAGAAGRQRVQESYLWPKITSQLEQVYLDAMRSPASPPVGERSRGNFRGKDAGRGAA